MSNSPPWDGCTGGTPNAFTATSATLHPMTSKRLTLPETPTTTPKTHTLRKTQGESTRPNTPNHTPNNPTRPQPATSPRIPRSPKANRWIQAKGSGRSETAERHWLRSKRPDPVGAAGRRAVKRPGRLSAFAIAEVGDSARAASKLAGWSPLLPKRQSRRGTCGTPGGVRCQRVGDQFNRRHGQHPRRGWDRLQKARHFLPISSGAAPYRHSVVSIASLVCAAGPVAGWSLGAFIPPAWVR